eukprot:gene5898-4214_t
MAVKRDLYSDIDRALATGTVPYLFCVDTTTARSAVVNKKSYKKVNEQKTNPPLKKSRQSRNRGVCSDTHTAHRRPLPCASLDCTPGWSGINTLIAPSCATSREEGASSAGCTFYESIS